MRYKNMGKGAFWQASWHHWCLMVMCECTCIGKTQLCATLHWHQLLWTYTSTWSSVVGCCCSPTQGPQHSSDPVLYIKSRNIGNAVAQVSWQNSRKFYFSHPMTFYTQLTQVESSALAKGLLGIRQWKQNYKKQCCEIMRGGKIYLPCMWNLSW